jgi:hypothetical protein
LLIDKLPNFSNRIRTLILMDEELILERVDELWRKSKSKTTCRGDC